ncbi:MAG: nuclear transport factor 2 family protein [Sphingobacteriia bacterium]
MNKKYLYLLIFYLFFTIMDINAQNLSPEQIVQKNLTAYNKRDINGFIASFSNDIALYNYGEAKPSIVGIDAIKAFYKRVFDASPNLHSTILKRIVFDNKVIDHERITGRVGSEKPVEIVLIYEIINFKIVKLLAIRK